MSPKLDVRPAEVQHRSGAQPAEPRPEKRGSDAAAFKRQFEQDRNVSTFERVSGAPVTKLGDTPDARVHLAGGPNGGPGVVQRDPALKPTTDAMLERLGRSRERIGGESPRSMFEKHILNNPRVTDEQIRQMSQVPLSRLADTPAAVKQTYERIPHARQTDNHRFTRDLLAGITGIDSDELSKAAPALGMTGTPGTVFWNSRVPKVQQFTAIHDTTSYLKDGGVTGLNRSLWGADSNVASAILGFPLGAAVRDQADVVKHLRRLDPEGARFIDRNLRRGSEGQLDIMKRLFDYD